MTDCADLLARIDAISGCAVTKRRVVEALRAYSGQRIWIARRELVLNERLRLAADLLDAHMTTAEASAVLVERIGVSLRTAQRLVLAARKHRAQRAALRQLSIPWP